MQTTFSFCLPIITMNKMVCWYYALNCQLDSSSHRSTYRITIVRINTLLCSHGKTDSTCNPLLILRHINRGFYSACEQNDMWSKWQTGAMFVVSNGCFCCRRSLHLLSVVVRHWKHFSDRGGGNVKNKLNF